MQLSRASIAGATAGAQADELPGSRAPRRWPETPTKSGLHRNV